MLIHTQQSELDLLALHSLSPDNYPFLLESVTRSIQSRYSILFAYPQESLSAYHNDKDDSDFLQRFDHIFAKNAAIQPAPDQSLDLPFTGGWFMYLAYEFAQQIEPSLVLPALKTSSSNSQDLAIAYAVRIPAAVIIDHHLKCSYIVCETPYQQLFDAIKTDINTVAQTAEETKPCQGDLNNIFHNVSHCPLIEDHPKKYLQDVATIRNYIAAGDVFQVNYSRAWTGTSSLSPQQLYALLRQANPAPFAALCVFNDWAIISSSPERLVRVKDQVAETRPIAGTRPRSASSRNDLALLEELINHPKERAEHIMLIDLERNDLGRICQAGSIEVDELMGVESYQHVHHIVSNIKGRLQAGTTPGEVLKAVFPGGTITGCPKVRCMEIIAQLEQTGRGAYTGSVGYINHNGNMDFNILIRSFTQIENSLNFRTGAGIVFDSIAENELNETRHKAKGLLKVFES
jgi:anthranilate synthase component 1